MAKTPAVKKATKKPVKVVAKSKPAPKKAIKVAVPKKAAPKKAVKSAAPAKKAVAKKAKVVITKKVAKPAPKKVVAAKPTPKATKSKAIQVKAVVVKKAIAVKKTQPVVVHPPKKAIAPLKKEKESIIKKTVEKPSEKKAAPAVEKSPKKVKEPINEIPELRLPPQYRSGPPPLKRSTLDTTRSRYPDSELVEFKVLITDKLDAARNDLRQIQSSITKENENSTSDTENRFGGMEDGAGTLEREYLNQMASRLGTYINHLEKALMRIENKTYGICRVTGKLISKERLRAVPHATLSLEAKEMKN